MLRTNRPTKSNLTYFFTEDVNQLRKLLSELGVMAHNHLTLETEKTKFSQKLTDEQDKWMKKNFKEKEIKYDYNIIVGFHKGEFKYKKI